ncbi:MAG TPA: acetylxylan esterase [Candidatus Acidoferrales bacterium]|nr:acetylxylan esterase [Candidatus Acidoferrales bacterium]
MKRFYLIPLTAALLWVTPAPAQSRDDWNFLSDPSVFHDIHGMLSAWLKERAFALLDERQRTIARIATIDDLKARQQYWRRHMLSYVGGLPERTPLNPRIVGTLDRGDYRVEKVLFESRPTFYVTANLYLPKNGKPPYPAILFPLGHETGAKAHEAWQRCLAGFARRGFVALAWDPLGQGERIQMYDEDLHDSKMPGSTVEHTIIGMQCLLTGTHVAQYTIWDGIRALDYLLSRPEVDARRVGCTGNSGGGTHTAYLSGLDDRIQAAAPSCYITSWRRMLESIGPQDAEQVFPLWLKDGLDYPDYLYAFGGKPFLMLTAIRDFFPIGGARASFAEAHGLFAKLSLGDRITMFEADDGHGYSLPRREAAYRWFSRWLQGTENTEPEGPLTLATAEELQCTATGQVKTEFPGAADVFSSNRKLAAQLRSERKPSAENVRRHARELTAYEAAPGPVRVTRFGRLERPGYAVEKLVYESEPGISIPALLFLPDAGEPRKAAVVFADAAGKGAVGAEAAELAAKGYIVLAPDLRGFGETQLPLDRRETFVRNFGDYKTALTALLIGKTMPGMRAADLVRAVDLLATRGDVDASRLAVAGRGAAAIPALLAALFDERIRSLALDGMLASYESVVNERIQQGIVDQIIPSALKYFDLPDLIAAVSPRRVAVFNAVNPLGQELTLGRMRPVFADVAAEIGVRDREETPFVPILDRFLKSNR